MNGTESIRSNLAGNGNIRPVAVQRWGALVGGAALAIFGVTRRSPLGVALAAGGGAIAIAGVRANRKQQESFATSSVLLSCTPNEAFSFWHDFENLPRFMNHLESVKVTGNRRSRWIAIGPVGYKVQWDAEIVNERENELIAWRSLPGSEIDVEGSVEFRPAPGNRGTLVTASVRYLPPAGKLGNIVAKLFGKDPNFLMRQDLRRFKALVETGEIPTTSGQTHGPRDLSTGVMRIVDPDQSIRGESRISELVTAQRRAS